MQTSSVRVLRAPLCAALVWARSRACRSSVHAAGCGARARGLGPHAARRGLAQAATAQLELRHVMAAALPG